MEFAAMKFTTFRWIEDPREACLKFSKSKCLIISNLDRSRGKRGKRNQHNLETRGKTFYVSLKTVLCLLKLVFDCSGRGSVRGFVSKKIVCLQLKKNTF